MFVGVGARTGAASQPAGYRHSGGYPHTDQSSHRQVSSFTNRCSVYGMFYLLICEYTGQVQTGEKAISSNLFFANKL